LGLYTETRYIMWDFRFSRRLVWWLLSFGKFTVVTELLNASITLKIEALCTSEATVLVLYKKWAINVTFSRE
jgi:hypothetical protein